MAAAKQHQLLLLRMLRPPQRTSLPCCVPGLPREASWWVTLTQGSLTDLGNLPFSGTVLGALKAHRRLRLKYCPVHLYACQLTCFFTVANSGGGIDQRAAQVGRLAG